MKSSWESGEGRMAMKPESKTKSKTMSQAIEDIKADIMNWGGVIETVGTLESGGKVQEITIKAKFRMH